MAAAALQGTDKTGIVRLCISAFWVAGTGEEFAPLPVVFYSERLAAFGTIFVHRLLFHRRAIFTYRLGILAIREIRTRHKPAVPTPFYHHRRTAFFAFIFGLLLESLFNLRAAFVRALEERLEAVVEIGNNIDPI